MNNGNRRAFLVGINDYPGSGSDLPSCLADVDAVGTVLSRDYGYDVEMLLDGEATVGAVRAGVARLCDGARANDRLCFFYSGHGTTMRRRNSIQECLFLGDGATLPDDDFVAGFAKVPPGASLVMLDACFSGGMEKRAAATADGGPLIKGVTTPTPDARKGVSKLANYLPFGSAGRRLKSALADGEVGDEVGDEVLNALLIAACQEGEAAMASTPDTMGLSAFTYAMLGSFALHGTVSNIDQLVTQATTELRRIGISQTPAVRSPSSTPGLAGTQFPILQRRETAMARGLGMWGALASASARAVASSIQRGR
ncbi:MAG: caspase family protein [Rhodospirillales bacterium]|nr:caspase family protein [Rhodospirillales bacterium]